MKSNETMFEEIVAKRDVLDAARKTHRRVTAAVLVPVLVLALAAPTVWWYRTKQQPPAAAPSNTAVTTVTDPALIPTLPDGSVNYTALTGGALPVGTGRSMTDMIAFDEALLKGTAWVIEGTVLKTSVADRTYVVLAPGKFGAETMTVTNFLQSNVTTFRVDRVLHGDKALEGQTLTLEDKLFSADGQFGYRVGTTYVLGVNDLGEDAAIEHLGGDETLLRGDLTRVSRYATMYSACVPPIEKTAAGDYIVPSCWPHLVRDGDTDVVLDESMLTAALPGADAVTLPPEAQAGDDAYVAMSPRGDGVPSAVEFYCKHMKLVPGTEFEARFDALLDALFAVSR